MHRILLLICLLITACTGDRNIDTWREELERTPLESTQPERSYSFTVETDKTYYYNMRVVTLYMGGTFLDHPVVEVNIYTKEQDTINYKYREHIDLKLWNVEYSKINVGEFFDVEFTCSEIEKASEDESARCLNYQAKVFNSKAKLENDKQEENFEIKRESHYAYSYYENSEILTEPSYGEVWSIKKLSSENECLDQVYYINKDDKYSLHMSTSNSVESWNLGCLNTKVFTSSIVVLTTNPFFDLEVENARSYYFNIEEMMASDDPKLLKLQVKAKNMKDDSERNLELRLELTDE